jgi:hypothetical protein
MKNTQINLTALSSTFQAWKNCIASGNKVWEDKHLETIETIIGDKLPSGSGIDTGTEFDMTTSSEDNLVFNTSFHHMDEGGGYDDWTEHAIILTPTFGDYKMEITGEDREGIKEYLRDTFDQVFTVAPENQICYKLPNRDDVEYIIECLEEHATVRGNAMASGNDAEDKEVEDSIIEDLENGNEWAWCTVKVTAKYKDIEGTDYLGGNSYKSEEDFITNSGYYEDMKEQAYTDLLTELRNLAD